MLRQQFAPARDLTAGRGMELKLEPIVSLGKCATHDREKFGTLHGEHAPGHPPEAHSPQKL